LPDSRGLEQAAANNYLKGKQMNEHFGLIARLAREHRLSDAVEDDLTRMAQKGASAPDLTAHVLATVSEAAAARRQNFPPAHQTLSGPASYSPNEAPEVPFPEKSDDKPTFASFGNREVPLPPVP
jgi:hypothetical protein